MPRTSTHTPAAEADPPDTLTIDDILQRAKGNSGSAVQDLEAELRRVVTAVYQLHVLEDQAGVSGEVTLKIKVTGDRGAEPITTSVTAKLPGQPKRQALLFGDEKGRLFATDPRQPRLRFGADIAG